MTNSVIISGISSFRLFLIFFGWSFHMAFSSLLPQIVRHRLRNDSHKHFHLTREKQGKMSKSNIFPHPNRNNKFPHLCISIFDSFFCPPQIHRIFPSHSPSIIHKKLSKEMRPFASALLFSLVLIGAIFANIDHQDAANMPTTAQNGTSNSGKNGVSCHDPAIGRFINDAVRNYGHNMGQLANYILAQIKRAHYHDYWLVHAEMIAGHPAGVQWGSVSNGDIFNRFYPYSLHGCYLNDGQTFVIVLRY